MAIISETKGGSGVKKKYDFCQKKIILGQKLISQGQKIAAAIPNARCHRLEGRNHVPLPQLDAWEEMMSELDAFLAT